MSIPTTPLEDPVRFRRLVDIYEILTLYLPPGFIDLTHLPRAVLAIEEKWDDEVMEARSDCVIVGYDVDTGG